MSSQKDLFIAIESLQRMHQSCIIDGDIDVKYFEDLIDTIYKCSQWITPQIAETAKAAVDGIEREIRKHLRSILKDGKNIPTTKRALSMYNSFHYTPPIIGFNRNA